MLPTLETPRLILRPLELADAGEIQRLFPQWEIVRHLDAMVPWPYPPDAAMRFLSEVALPAQARGEQWNWTLRLRQSPEQLIGSVRLNRGESKNRGFWLGLPWHGQGLMTEAVAVTSDFWFDVLGFPVLRVTKAAANIASRRISEKTGMRLIGTTEKDYVCGRLSTEIWEITAGEWHAFRQRWRSAAAPTNQPYWSSSDVSGTAK
jgi:[ribosomal protein S5]-alanine N-acetyltransferase